MTERASDGPNLDQSVPTNSMNSLQKRRTGGLFTARRLWIGVLTAMTASIIVGLFELSLNPIKINSEVFWTVNITVEMVRLAFCIAIFGVVWLTRSFSLDRRSLIISMAFLATGAFVGLRLLTSPGMPSIGGAEESIDHTMYFSEFVRYTLVFAMLATAFLPKNSQLTAEATRLPLLITVFYAALATFLVLWPDTPLPHFESPTVGLHPAFISLEYGVIVLSFIAALGYARIAESTHDADYAIIAFGLVLFAQAGFAYMNSPVEIDAVFLIGRVTALIGFFLVFYGITRMSLYAPYAKLEKAREDFTAAKSEAESKAAELRVLAQDLKERRLVEAQLRKSEKGYRDLVETTAEGIWKIDHELRTSFVNSQMSEMLGYTPSEMIGRPALDFIASESRESFNQHMEKRRRGIKERYDIALLRKDGSKLYASTSATPTVDELGEYTGSVAFLTDVTEMRMTMEALRTSERLLFAFLADLPVGIIVSDPSGSFIFSNDKARQILGKDLETSGANERADMFHNAYVADTDKPYPSERSPIRRALSGETSMVDDVEIRKPNEAIRLEIWGAPVTDQEKRILYGIAAFMDITRRKETEKEIFDLNQSLGAQSLRLAEMNRELEAFSYSISHDLRTPLRAIDGFSNILEEHYSTVLDDKGKDYLNRIRAGCKSMGQLIDDMLRLSRVTRDEMTWKEVNLSEIAKSVVEELEKTVPDWRCKVVVRKGVIVHGDERLYRILMTNLLDNACKFAEKNPKPVIEFGVTTINNERTYFVRDNGAGFDMKYADRLFVPFQRLHSSAEFAGTGIGLAIAQRIVRRHGGRIWAEAQVGKGATFYFTEGTKGMTSEV